MTAADRVNARGRSLFGWGVLHPNAERRPSLSDQLGRAAHLSNGTVDSDYEYATYAPEGTLCVVCKKPLGALEVVRRSHTPRQSGPDVLTYRHFDTCKPAKGA